MGTTSDAIVLDAEWSPRAGYHPNRGDVTGKRTYSGSQVWQNPRLAVRSIEIPTPGPDEVLLKVRACGICGSDIHMCHTDRDGYIAYPGLTAFPVVIGHEFAGEIIQKGSQVTGLDIGEPVTVEEMQWCGVCDPCRAGIPNHCSKLEEIGFTVSGGFSGYATVKAKYCWSLRGIEARHGKDRALELGALTEPTAVSYHAIFQRGGGIRPGAFTTVFGCGPIGLACCALLKVAGASMIIAVDPSPERRELALKVGATLALDPLQSGFEEALEKASEGAGFDFQVEAAGDPDATMPKMLRSLAVGGTIVHIGRSDGDTPLYLERLQTRGANIVGSQGHSGHFNFRNVIRLVESGLLDLSPIITHRLALESVPAFINSLDNRSFGKAMALMP
jgi:threonine dehydrogenase-like Zn-dependent dehydrogenase